MDINRELLTEKFNEGDFNTFFKEAMKIADFVIADQFKIYDIHIKQDMLQECMENLWKKIQQGKVDPTKNLFAFIWRNSQFRILEILRKEKRRKEIVHFTAYDDIDGETDYFDYISHQGNKYMSTLVKELSTA